MSKRTISTLPRYVFLNSYAFLLLAMGIGMACLPLHAYSRHWLWLQVPFCIFCFYEACHILQSWQDKKRKYHILIERNTPDFRPDTFNEYMQAPCGRLLTLLVLKDLGILNEYKQLKSLQKHIWQITAADCRPQKTRVYINPNYQSK